MRFTAWSPSRLGDYDQCPALANYKHNLKLCPRCFKGKITGGFSTPAVCDTCKAVLQKSEALERGTRIGDELDAHITGAGKLPSDIKNPAVKKVVKWAKAQHAKGEGSVQFDLALTRDWERCDGWDRRAWLRCRLDYVSRPNATEVEVIDWKTGGLEKDGSVRVDAKYDDQLGLYAVAVFSVFPMIQRVRSKLVFLDAHAPHDPVVERKAGAVERSQVEDLRRFWSDRARPMLSDDLFAPTPSFKCRWCDFSKAAGGPCKF